jgi:hypothetical protein
MKRYLFFSSILCIFLISNASAMQRKPPKPISPGEAAALAICNNDDPLLVQILQYYGHTLTKFKNVRGENLLHIATQYSSVQGADRKSRSCCNTVFKILKYTKIDVDEKDAQGTAPLHHAAIAFDLYTVELLLNRNADPNITYKKQTPLDYILNLFLDGLQETLNATNKTKKVNLMKVSLFIGSTPNFLDGNFVKIVATLADKTKISINRRISLLNKAAKIKKILISQKDPKKLLTSGLLAGLTIYNGNADPACTEFVTTLALERLDSIISVVEAIERILS